MAVANGQVDAAANNTESLALIEANNPDAFGKIKVIWKSPLIPADPIVWHKELPQKTKDKIKSFFLTYGTDQSDDDAAEEKKILSELQWAPFKDSSDDQLLPVRVMELSKEIAQIKADTTMTENAKKAAIDKLEAEKAGYEKKIKSAEQS